MQFHHHGSPHIIVRQPLQNQSEQDSRKDQRGDVVRCQPRTESIGNQHTPEKKQRAKTNGTAFSKRIHNIAVCMEQLGFLCAGQDICFLILSLKTSKTNPKHRMILEHVAGALPKEDTLPIGLDVYIRN